MTEYTEIADPEIQARVRGRYENEISALQTLGFSQLAYKLEYRGPLSVLWSLPILPLMRKAREVLVFPFPLRLGLANMLMVHSAPPAISDCMGLGVKFFTSFSDGTLVISSTLESHLALQDLPVKEQTNVQVIRTPACRTISHAWTSHKQQTSELKARGKAICNTSSFTDYVEISRREEADLRSRCA